MLIRRDEHKIDKLFRKKLHDAQDEVPLHLWEGVRTNSHRKRRFPLFWWWLGSAAVVGGIAFALVFQPAEHVELAANLDSAEVEVSSKSNSLLNTKSSVESSGANVSMPSFDEKDVFETNVDLKTSQANVKHKATDAHFRIESHVPKSSSKLQNKRPQNQQQIATEQLFDAVLHDFAQSQNHLLGADQIAKAADEEDSEPKTINLDSSIENEILNGSAQSGIQTNIPASKEHWTANRLMTGVGFSMANPVRKAAGNADQGLFALDQRTRPETEMTWGLGVGYRIWKGLSIWSGLERSEFDESHQWRDSIDVIHFETFVDYEISYPGNDQNPVITAVVDTSFSQTKEVVTGMVRNKYTSWNVPLTVGWQQPIHGQFYLFAETGPVFRLDSRYEGMFVFTDTATPISADQLSNFPMPSSSYDEKIYLRQYYKNWKMDWHAALSLGWMSKSGLGYSIGVRHRRMVGETGEQHNFSHRIQSTGFNIGVQYRF